MLLGQLNDRQCINGTADMTCCPPLVCGSDSVCFSFVCGRAEAEANGGHKIEMSRALRWSEKVLDDLVPTYLPYRPQSLLSYSIIQ